MSVYNSNVQSKIIDPVYDKSNFRSEYRLDSNSVYLSNFRLSGMGIETNTSAEPYNPLLGAFCIQSLQLYDGNQLLDQVLSADLWNAFKNFNNSNDENVSVNNWTNRGSYGFAVNTINASQAWQDWGNIADLPNVDENKINVFAFDEFTNSRTPNDPSASSWFSLKGYLAFLTSSLYVPTSVFKNLRLVINWKNNQQLKDISIDPSQEFETFTNVALIVDEVTDDKIKDVIMKNYQGVVYKPVEHDQVVVNAITPSAGASEVQRNRFLVNGFNNKTLERLVCIQSPTDKSTYSPSANVQDGVGIVGSFAQLKSEFQFRVNGQNKLPRDGFTGKNQRLGALVDTYGESSLPSFCNFVYVPNLDQHLMSLADDGLTQGMHGQLDWTAIDIQDQVQELVVEYNRTGVHGNDRINQGLRLNLFGEVVKAVSVDKNNNYIIQYL